MRGENERSLPPPRASRGPPPSSEGGKVIVLTTRLYIINRGWRASTARPYGDQTKRHCRGDQWSPVGGTMPFPQTTRRRSHVIVGADVRDGPCATTPFPQTPRRRFHVVVGDGAYDVPCGTMSFVQTPRLHSPPLASGRCPRFASTSTLVTLGRGGPHERWWGSNNAIFANDMAVYFSFLFKGF